MYDAFVRHLASLPSTQRNALSAAVRSALSKPVAMESDLLRDAAGVAGMQTGLGLVPYALEAPALNIWPVVTLLRNRIPRRVVGGTQTNFKKITAIDTAEDFGFVTENADTTANTVTGRAGFLKMTEVDGSATFRTLGLDNFLTVQQQKGGASKIDGADFLPEELWTLALLQAVMMREEKAILGANSTALTAAALGTPSKTGITQAATGLGSLSNATNYYIKVSALTLKGYRQGAAGHGSADAPGETDGTSEATIATTSGGSAGDKSLTIGWTAVKGAVAYNVYAGATTGASVKYNQTVTTNRAYITSIETTTNVPNSADQTADTYAYDGLISQFQKTTGTYYKTLNGSALTGDSMNGVQEFEDAFAWFFTKLVSPSAIILSATERPKVDKLFGGASAPAANIFLQANDAQNTILKGGISVSSVLNRYFNKQVELITHPYLPSGTALFICDQLGEYYPTAQLPNPIEMLLGWEYMRFDFANTSLRKEAGIYVNGAPVVRVPFVCGSIQCIG